MTHAPNSGCPSAETLAAFAEGRLKGAQAAPVVAHLDTCDVCVGDVALGMRAVEEEEINVVRPRRWMPWLGAVAAAIVIALAIPFVREWRRSPIEQLVAATPKAARTVEPRLAGGFAWAPYRGSERASGSPTSDPERMRLTGVAGEVVARAQDDASADAQHDAGVAMVLTQNAEEAIARLEKAAAATPSAQTWSDLAAARYAAASDLGRPALYPQALAAADNALRLDANLPEALFNRALILQRMWLADAARDAWTRYLAVDPSSQWAVEARAHLAELPASQKSSQFERIRPQLEEAAVRGDAKTVRAFLAEHSARARAFAEGEYLGQWGESVLQKKDEDARRWLTIARAIAQDQDELLRDAVQAIDAAQPSQRERIAAAHAAYRAGRIAYSRKQLDQALKELGRAAALFAETRSPMVLMAQYYIASVHLAQHEPTAGLELQRVLTAADAHPGYRSLQAHVRWELGRAYMFDYDWTRAISSLSESAGMFRETGDRASEAVVDGILAFCLSADGRGDEAWTWRIHGLRALSTEGNPARLATAINGAMRADFFAGRNDAALALARIPQPVAGNAEQLSLVLDALVFESMLESQSGSTAVGLDTARRAGALAQTIDDPSLRARRLADVDVVTAAAMADPVAATAMLTRAIDFYRGIDLSMALPEPLLLRARRAMPAEAAMRDLEEGMQIVERHRAGGTGVLDAERALFADAIRLALDHRDEAAAFAFAERARGATVTLGDMQQRLGGSATAVLEIAMLPGEIVSFAVSENDFQSARRPNDAAALTRLAEASLSEDGSSAAATLYDALVRPVAAVLARAQHVVVVADPRLGSVPFAALYDRDMRTHLVERVSVAIASNAGSLQRSIGRAEATVVTMSLPTGEETGTVALPQAREELAEIASLYPRATTIAPNDATLSALRDALSAADVVHVAGHTERQSTGGEHALLLAGSRASSRTIAAMPLARARLLVLAACETLRPPASPETRALSLGGAFAAAGVGEVIGTLTPVGDRDARTFFRDLHRHLAAGSGAGDALRLAQIDAIRGAGSRAWRSVALITSRIDTGKGRSHS